MSPNIVSAPEQVNVAGNTSSAGEYGAMDREAVAVRSLALAVTSGSPVEQPGDSAVGQAVLEHSRLVGLQYDRQEEPGVVGSMVGRQNATQAAMWGSETLAQRRGVPVWLQRIGSFFQEMRNNQGGNPLWMPSPLGSPETPEGQQRAGGLFSPEQRSRVRSMEQRAPLLHGAPPRDESSGGSTQEARRS